MKLITVQAILWILMPPTAMSTSSCICDSDAEVTIVTDSFSSETSWIIETDDESCGTYSLSYGADSIESDVTLTATNLCLGISYTFTIVDSYGDGICCTSGQGSYELKIADEVVASGGEFDSTESTIFMVGEASTDSPTESPTDSPTVSPTESPTNSMRPTPCSDSTTYSYTGYPKRNCKWASKNPEKRCNRPTDSTFDVQANCPVACGTCAPIYLACHDSTTFYLGDKKHRNCRWARGSPAKRCNKPVDRGNLVKGNCPVACDACP